MNQQSPFHAFQSTAQLPGSQPGFLAKALALLLSAAFVVLTFMFSLVALAVLAIGGLGLGGWLWWKTRKLRQQMRADMAQAFTGTAASQSPAEGQIIEGECVREASRETLLR